MTQRTRARYVSTVDERLARLAERWPPGALVRNLGGGLRGVITVAADDIAKRWNDGSPGHLALMPLRKEPGLGGMVYADWEHGDSCWSRVDVLEIVDRIGLYRRFPARADRAPIFRLAASCDELVWWGGSHLLPGWSWAARTDPAVIEALRQGRELKVGWA